MPKKENVKTIKVKYTGPHGKVTHALTGLWKKGETKELLAPVAEALLAGNANFKKVN